jgi:hypothetical protein
MRAFASARRGRPRKVAAEKEPANDRGTVELQRKRAALARGLDPASAAHPLDLLLAQGAIDAEAHQAGLAYAGLYRRLAGRTDVSCARRYAGFGLASGSAGRTGANDNDPILPHRRFRLAQAALAAEGRAAFLLTERVAVFADWQSWLPADSAGTALLRRGLAALGLGLRQCQGAGKR